MAWSLSWTSTPVNQVLKTRPCTACIKKRGHFFFEMLLQFGLGLLTDVFFNFQF